MKHSTIILMTLMFLMSGVARAEKTDIIILKNGDRVTGEIKTLEAGLLEFKTDTMGTVRIEWRFISEIISSKHQSIETAAGQRLLGTLQKPSSGDHVMVETARGPIDLAPHEVVSVWPVEAGFKEKMDLDFGAGVDYSKSTDIANLNISTDFRYLTNDRQTESSLRTNITHQPDGDDQTRNTLKGSHEYLLPEKRFRKWTAGLETNEALGIDLRLTFGGTFGKYLVKTNNTWFTVSGGLAATQETPENASSETNLEAVGTLRYRYFRYATPERSLDTNFSVYPSLTDGGRVRADLTTTFKLEMVEDLFWALEFYADYDNEPLSTDADKFDYGFISSIGWSY